MCSNLSSKLWIDQYVKNEGFFCTCRDYVGLFQNDCFKWQYGFLKAPYFFFNQSSAIIVILNTRPAKGVVAQAKPDLRLLISVDKPYVSRFKKWRKKTERSNQIMKCCFFPPFILVWQGQPTTVPNLTFDDFGASKYSDRRFWTIQKGMISDLEARKEYGNVRSGSQNYWNLMDRYPLCNNSQTTVSDLLRNSTATTSDTWSWVSFWHGVGCCCSGNHFLDFVERLGIHELCPNKGGIEGSVAGRIR